MKQSQRRIKVGFVLLSLLLAACASKPPRLMLPVESEMPEPIRFKASFDCTQSASTLQDVVCADNALATLDRDMADAYRTNLRSLDLVGRMQLIANQRHWLLGRAPQCKLSATRLGTAKPDPKQVACLSSYYRNRIAELKTWPQPQACEVASRIGADKFHPLSAYVEFRLVDGRDATLCAGFSKQFNDAIGAHGDVNFARMNGFAEIAGTHGTASATSDGRSYSVGLYDAGPYASYQRRAIGFDIDGQTAIHDRSIGEWVAQLPNAGGRFGDTSSQTRDYAAIDVFRFQQRSFALVTEAWGYYSAAALGESDYAGVYDLSSGSAQPLCLYSTYLVPPIARAFDTLPAYKALNQTLLQMSGEPPMLEMDERSDESLLQRETEWNLLNMPLVAVGEIERFGREAALRQRHDAALDAIWSWSERNVPSKLLYRRLLPMVQPAYDELVASFQHTQGLKPEEAQIAANLMIMDLIDRAAENLSDFNSAKAAPLLPFAQYNPRYAPAPVPGDLERGRKLATLHSAALNRAPAATIADFIKYEAAMPTRGIGPAGDTALMAAVRVPETVKQLLDAGFDVNAGNDWKKTALMAAAQANQLASTLLLLDAGANVNAATIAWHADDAGAVDNDEGAVAGRTALMYAAANGSAELVQLLVSRGANVNARDARNDTACSYLKQNTIVSETEQRALKTSLCR
ncbi:exported protein of unknown function [Georgfuchsia toluolica]|uniref:Lysozyme inhibitor LprI-like N-terminal domain-containing protein n=1 Tax=Georgfuchsia toluolica TaxID=424218 RepID=A0A916N1P6_9PROT|nr:ankyrin repeat domain-containing protein [Georgfuchsia toluolica]CAG4885160.1 exported protein of unknown function [Georgfuchsia toluolica]